MRFSAMCDHPANPVPDARGRDPRREGRGPRRDATPGGPRRKIVTPGRLPLADTPGLAPLGTPVARVHGDRMVTHHRGDMMNNTSKRIEGAAEQMGGAIKKGVGSLIGDQKMVAEGSVAEVSGEVRQKLNH